MINSRRLEINGGELFIAYFEENSELDLSLAQLTNSDKERLEKMKSTLRQKEFILTRMLLSSILPNEEIVYSESGAPMLRFSSKKISISHTQNCVAIMFSEDDCGLDIEHLDRDYLKISHKYLTQNDIIAVSKPEFALFWAAKEAVYKLFKGENIEIFSDISIKRIKYDSSSEEPNCKGFLAIKVKKESVKAHFLVEKGQVIVYSASVLNKIAPNS